MLRRADPAFQRLEELRDEIARHAPEHALADGSDFVLWTVNCNEMSAKEAAKVSKGEQVTVIGEFDDGGDLGVEIANAHLVG